MRHLHRDVGPAGAELGAPAFHVVLVVRCGRAAPAGTRWAAPSTAATMRSGARCNRFQMKRAADAEAQHHEFPDAQVIHQPELVVGVGVPGPVDLERAGGLAAVGVAQVRRDAAVLALELLHRR